MITPKSLHPVIQEKNLLGWKWPSEPLTFPFFMCSYEWEGGLPEQSSGSDSLFPLQAGVRSLVREPEFPNTRQSKTKYNNSFKKRMRKPYGSICFSLTRRERLRWRAVPAVRVPNAAAATAWTSRKLSISPQISLHFTNHRNQGATPGTTTWLYQSRK